MKNGREIIDMHTHMRNDMWIHTKNAKKAGIDVIVYMANYPVIDSLEKVLDSLKKERYYDVKALPVCAITKGLEGNQLVDTEKIKEHVVGFSDDGRCLQDLGLFREALSSEKLILVHCEPETEYIEKYLEISREVKEGKLHIQHVSRADSVKLIREAKKSLQFTCETAPHYYLSKYQLNPCESGEYPCPYRKETKKQVAVNPPIGNWGDSLEIKRGLADGTIDCIATDYAPEPHPRKTGIACFENLFNSELIKEGWLSEEDFYTKISGNPRKIISK